MPTSATQAVELTLSTKEDGAIEAMYLRLASRWVHRTREVREDVLLADYDRGGRLVGIEVLAPVRLAEITSLVDEDRRAEFRRLIRRLAPAELVR